MKAGTAGGTSELGMALVLGLRVIVVGRREHVFHYLPEAELVANWPEALRLLAQSFDAAVAL